MLHYHGTPITPRAVLETLHGKLFCVSYAKPDDCAAVHRLGQSVMLDNGAYTVWRQGRFMDWDRWADWAVRWLDYRTTWAVLPDVIDGDWRANAELLERFDWLPPDQVAPVWHLHEPLDWLADLVGRYRRVCFGSSGEYAEIGTVGWHRRISEAFDRIADPDGRVPWVHMLRGMQLAGSVYPFASVDSTDVARNHPRPWNTARILADRWDAQQAPARWHGAVQLGLELAG